MSNRDSEKDIRNCTSVSSKDSSRDARLLKARKEKATQNLEETNFSFNFANNKTSLITCYKYQDYDF